MTGNKPTVNLAVIGCGAVTERGHLPALREAGCFKLVTLVDRNQARAKALADTFAVPKVFSSFEQAIPEVDAAIVALPHSLHAPVSSAFLEAGKHVLVEKPMAITSAQCQEMMDAAERGRATLAVGHMRRFFPGLQLAKQCLDRGMIGRVRQFDFRDGYTYSWPVASDFFFKKETAGGGVLLDTGAHTVDTLLWFLGDVAEFSYRDDSHGGVEADCLIDITLKSGATGIVELSRTRILRNSALIAGDEGVLEVFFHKSKINFQPKCDRAFSMEVQHDGCESSSPGLVQMLRDQLIDWHGAITNRREPFVSGTDGLRVVALMERMYEQRKPLIFPWETAASREAGVSK